MADLIGIMNKKSILVVLALLLPTLTFAQKLSQEEQKLAAIVDRQSESAVNLLQKVVDIESPTQNLAGVKEVGRVFKAEFEKLGMTAKWIEMPAEMKKAGHLQAETKGSKGKRILLLGHLDTVLSGEKFRLDGMRAYGTGTSDMKAGDIVILYALKALHEAGYLKDTRIVVMMTGDEEASGKPVSISRGDMVAAAKNSDLVLSFEGAVRDTATVGRRGASSWTLEVSGNTGHSSGIFGENMGSGAIYEASRIVNEFYQKLRGEQYLTFNTSLFLGGTEVTNEGFQGSASGKDNVVPGRAVVKGDLRFISEEQKESARARMREIVAAHLPKTTASISFEDGIPAMTPREGNFELLKKMSQVSEDLGNGPIEALDPGQRGAGDIAFVSDIIPGLDGLGARGGNSHAAGEWSDLQSMPMLVKRVAILIYRLSR